MQPFMYLLLAAWFSTGSAMAQAPASPAATPGTGQPRPAAPFASPTNPAATPPRASAVLACLILPFRSADIGSPLAGVIESVAVDRGDMVRRGQELVQFRAEVEAAQIEATRLRAESEAELRGAMAAQDLALQRLERARRLQSEGFVSTQAVEQAESEWRVAKERVEQAHDVRRVAAREAGVSRAQAAQRVLRAPFDGVVTERYAHPGERFEERPLLRIAMVNALRVEAVIPAARFGQVQVGQQAQVQPEVPGAAARGARVTQVDRVLDPASNTFRVRMDLPNADLSLPAGARCRVDFGWTSEPPAQRPALAPSASVRPALTPEATPRSSAVVPAAAATAR